MPGQQLDTSFRTFWVIRGTRLTITENSSLPVMTDVFYSSTEGFTDNVGSADHFETQKDANSAIPGVYRSDESWIRVWVVRSLCRLKEYK